MSRDHCIDPTKYQFQNPRQWEKYRRHKRSPDLNLSRQVHILTVKSPWPKMIDDYSISKRSQTIKEDLLAGEFHRKIIIQVEDPQCAVYDYPGALAENLLENVDHLVELARDLVFSDSLARKNPVDLISDPSTQQTLQGCGETLAQNFLEYEDRGARHLVEPSVTTIP